MGGSDYGDCYNRVAHLAASLTFQGWGISRSACRVLQIALQTMHYCLRTGFGKSTQTYGGTTDNPYQWYDQGNCASPSGFAALGALAVNAYRCMGHGDKLTSSYTARMFILAAVMFVDDTDLLHWAPSHTTTPDELVTKSRQPPPTGDCWLRQLPGL